MPAHRPLDVVLTARRVERPAPMTHDRLGRPLVGPCLIWIWEGDPPKDGYARITNTDFGTKAPQLAHRAAWAMANGVALDRLKKVPELDHLCRVHACSSAGHLEPVTRKENLRRGDGNQNVGKTHCIRNHPLSGDNLIERAGGRRGCRACKTAANRESWRRRNRPELLGLPLQKAGRKAKRS